VVEPLRIADQQVDERADQQRQYMRGRTDHPL
jgi:hypothetical protein